MITLKILSESNIHALQTLEQLVPHSKIREMRVDSLNELDGMRVYTIKIQHANKIAV